MRMIQGFLFALLFAWFGTAQAQVVFGYHDNLVRAKDSLIVDNDFMKSADTIVFLTDVTYHEFSVDGISWSKNPSASDKWMRVSSDAKFNWKILSLEGLEMYWLNDDGVTYTNPVYGDTVVIAGTDAEGFVLNVNGNTNSDYYFIGGDSLKLTNIYNGGGTDGQYLVLSGDTAIWQNLPSGFGETNFGRNVNTRGYGVYEGKTDTVLDFRGIASLTDMLTVTLASEDSTIDLDLALKTITTGIGLTGGTSMESDMTLNFNIPTKFPTFNDTVDVDADWWVFYDVSAGTHYKLHFSDLLADYGFPAGGDSGQILVKLSDEDYDVGWVDPCVAIAGCSDTIISIIYDTIRVIIEDEVADITGNIIKTFTRTVCNDEYTILASYFGDTIESVYISSLPDVGELYWGTDTVQAGDTLTATAGVFDSTFVYTASFDYTTAYVDAFDFKIKYADNAGFLAQHTFYLDVSSCDGVADCVEYGYLYNWYAGADGRGISSSDNWTIPTKIQWEDLGNYVGTLSTAGYYLRSSDIIYWNSPNTGIDAYGLNLRGSGERSSSNGNYSRIKENARFWTPTLRYGSSNWYVSVQRSNDYLTTVESGWKQGLALRLVSDATGVADGTTTVYVGNDGKTYSAIAINGLYWTQYNLAETLYRNGDPIPTVEDATTWAGLTTGAKCAYENNYSYVGCDEEASEPVDILTFEYISTKQASVWSSLTYPYTDPTNHLTAQEIIEPMLPDAYDDYSLVDYMEILEYSTDDPNHHILYNGVEITAGDKLYNNGNAVFNLGELRYKEDTEPTSTRTATLVVRFIFINGEISAADILTYKVRVL